MSHGPALPKVNGNDPMPKYLQAREILLGAIRAGYFTPGSKLPSTEEISSLVDISLITAHKAMEGLVEMGWLRREVGRGTYVREDVDLVNGTPRRKFFIGLLFDHQEHVNIDDYYHGSLINGLRRAARADSDRRIEFFFDDRFDLRDKARQDVGAICFHPPLESQSHVGRISRRHPVVILGGSAADERVAAVDCDNENGARKAIRHLLELGHRRFMIVSGPLNLSNARDRAVGATSELAAHGIRVDKRDTPVSKDSVVLDEETKARIERRLTDTDRPTAILAGGFYLALATMQAARQVGLRIPDDASVIGFDDPPSAPLLDPPLTTVRQPLMEMAANAYRLVCQTDNRNRTSCKLSTELVVRNSTGPVRL